MVLLVEVSEMSYKLNLGCGLNYLKGWLNVDIDPRVNADEVWDFNVLREELHWCVTHVQHKNLLKRTLNLVINKVANVNSRKFEKMLVYYVGGFEEISGNWRY
jgi:hypothetical protein